MHWGIINKVAILTVLQTVAVSSLLLLGLVTCCFVTFGVNFLLKMIHSY